MHYTSPLINLEGTEQLHKMVEQRKVPNHREYENQRRVEALEMLEHPNLDDLHSFIEKLAESTQPKSNQHSYIDANLRHWRTIVYNLIRATATNKWLGLAGDSNAYTRGAYYNSIGLSYRGTQKVLFELMSRGWIVEEKGAKYTEEPRVNHYYPSAEFQSVLVDYAVFTHNPSSFDGQLLTINDPDPQYASFRWTKTHHDYVPLAEINEFARTQQWACRSAITQSFKRTPFQSGRLLTPFQNLQSRDYKIRINTLINGNPIAEVDFNANHLRLFLALHKRDVIGGHDAYEAIVEVSGAERDKVKGFINVGLNSDSFESAKYTAARKFSVRYTDSVKISEAFAKLYPNLDLHCGFALQAMQMEGLILRDVLHEGASKGILALPVHDAVAVEAEHREWAVEAMTASWERWVRRWHSTAKASVK